MIIKKLTVMFAGAVVLLAQTSSPSRPEKPGTPDAPATARAPGSATQAGPTFDKAAIEAYLRYLLMWNPGVDVTVTDPLPGPMPGYFQFQFRGTLGGKSREETFYISADGQNIVHGDVFDIKRNPFEESVGQLKLEGQPFLGAPGAPVTIVEFADFQCPYCKQESTIFPGKLLDAFPNDVRLVFVDYPLVTIHPYARQAAILGRCVYDQNSASFWPWYDWMFAHQGEFTPDNLGEKVLAYAGGDKNLDAGRLATCALAPEPRTEVDRDIAIGNTLKVGSTPTLFVNGRRLVGTISLEDLKSVVNEEISYLKAQKKDADCCSVQLALPGAAAEKASGK